MKLITRQLLADEVANGWYERFANTRWWDDPADPKYKNKGATYQKLLALGEHPDPDDVDRVIGNDTWTNIKCHECETQRLEFAVKVGAEPYYGSNTACLCLNCITKALTLVISATK